MAARFIDARADGIGPTIDAAVCILGGGAAGITLARALAPTVPGVVLIESGGLEPEGETQDLYSGQNLGFPYYNLAACRVRFFGGTTNAWYGHSRDNDPIDYEGRPELGLPKWPVGRDVLAPYIAQALVSLGNDPRSLDAEFLVRRAGLATEGLVDRLSAPLATKVFQRTETLRFSQAYHDELAAFANLTTCLHLNATHLQLSPDGARVVHAGCKTLDGRAARITAKFFVLCCGAIENARLLLVSNDVATAGIGNGFDHVGRYFMDHIHLRASRFVPGPAFPAVYDRSMDLKRGVLAEIGLKDAFLRSRGIAQYYCEFVPVYEHDDVRRAVGGVRAGFMRPGNRQFLRDIATILGDLGGAAKYAATARGGYVPPDWFELDHRVEQTPNRDSRVVISGRRDALGGLIADLDWRIGEHEYRAFRVGQETLVRELSALGIGRAEYEEPTEVLVRERGLGHFHHTGTTRMAETASQGVVNPACRVHGVGNLFVCSSSVFPSAGYGNPTVTIMAFALRLADHLKRAAFA